MSDGASLQGEMVCPDCPLTKNQPKGDVQRLLVLSTISNSCTVHASEGIPSNLRIRRKKAGDSERGLLRQVLPQMVIAPSPSMYRVFPENCKELPFCNPDGE